MPSCDDILDGVQRQRLSLQDYVPLADSLDWTLGHLYWKRAGASAFLSDHVPTRIISDGNISAGSAETLFTALLAAESGGTLGDEISVLEVGAGAGLFARYFLDHFRTICRDYKKPFYDRLRYVLTDASAKMLEDIARAELLADHAGRYELREADATAPSFGLPEGSRFHWIVFNYVLDTLPAAIVRADGDGFALLCIRTSLERGYGTGDPVDSREHLRRLVDAGDLDSLIGLYPHFSINHRFEPLDIDDLPFLNQLAASAEGNTVLVHNYGAIACLHEALELLHPDGCIQIADYAPPEYDDAVGLPHRWEHYAGSTSVGINFPLLARHFSDAGFVWAEPDGRNNIIEIRLVAPKIAPSALEAFRIRFGASAFRWRLEPARRARQLLSEGNIEAALAAFRAALSRQPRNWALMEEIARLIHESFDAGDSAMAMIDEAIGINPIHPPLHALRAVCFFAGNRLVEAQQAARRALELDPQNLDALLTLVRIHRAARHFPEALAVIAAALSIDGGGSHRAALLAEQSAVADALARRAATRDRRESRFAGEG